MGISIEDLNRAGLVETVGSKLEKKQHGATNVRSARAEARKADIRVDSSGKDAVLERDARNGALGEVQVQKGIGQQFLIRVITKRKILLDDDNCCEKFHVDLLRYASGGVLGDSRKTTRIEVRQEKAQDGESEETRLEVYEV